MGYAFLPQTPADVNELDPAKKDKKYCTNNARRIYSNYMNGAVQGFFAQKAQWKLNSKYSMGRQPIDNYKKLLGRDTTEQFDSLNFAVTKIMPKIFDILVGMISRIPVDVQADAIDPTSCDAKLKVQYKKEAEIFLRDQIAFLEKETGVKLQDATNEYASIEELAMDVEAGNLKLDFEIAVEELVKAVFNHNKMEELILMMTRDNANCGMSILRHYVTQTGLIKIRRVNPIFFVSNFVTSRDFRELSQAGELVNMTISDLREVAGSEFSEQDYYEIACKVQNKYGNNTSMTAYGSAEACWISSTGSYIYDKFIVRVFDCEFQTTDRYSHTVDKVNRYGNKETRQKKSNYVPSERSVKHTKRTDYKVWYGCKWIIGTEYSYGCGKVQFPNVQSNALNESKSTFAVCALHIDDMITQTITERCIEYMDDIVLSYVQMQSYTAKAVPPGITVDTTAISNIPKGKGSTWQPDEMIEYYTKTGNLMTNMMLPDGRQYQKLPVQENKGSDLNQIQFWMNKIMWNIDQIKQVMGLNDFTDASNPNPEQSVGNAKLAVQGTTNSLQPLITAMDNVIVKAAEGVVNRAQHMASLGQLDYLASAIGRNNLMVLGFSKEVTLATFAIKLSPRMDDMEKAVLEDNIRVSLQQRSQTGVGGIEIEDAIAIRRCKDIKQAERMLIYRRKKRAAEDEEKSARLQEQNAQVQQQSAMAIEQAKQQTMMVEFEMYRKKKLEVDLMYEMELKKLEGMNKQQQIVVQGQAKQEEIMLQGDLTREEMLLQGEIDKEEIALQGDIDQLVNTEDHKAAKEFAPPKPKPTTKK